ncbi:MAG TPA: pseudouridine synthase [Oscillospiraceae bacterium]|nr:pseudouridine synthase [Oscillospiraceae bacterium]HRW56497.1 pseudouridine synthase [Oscillospiraceae bacterium]
MRDTRIQKALSDAGYTSRRKAEELIAAGKVTVNGHPAEIGMKVDVKKDLIAVDGQTVPLAQDDKLWYIALNKPRGFVTTTSDDLGRKCVTELVQDIPARVYPIGRLDRVSEGLLLFTNDGDFANEIMRPRSQVTKTYRVTVRGEVKEESLIQLCEGVEIDSGMTLPAQVTVLEKMPERSVLQFVISEGKNREIRKMCEAVGLEVIRLKRTAIGAVKLGMLPIGKWRELTKEELTGLRAIAKKGEAATHQKEMESAARQKHLSGKATRPSGKAAAESPTGKGGFSSRQPEKDGRWTDKKESRPGKFEHRPEKTAHGDQTPARTAGKPFHTEEKPARQNGKPEYRPEKPTHGSERPAGKTGAPAHRPEGQTGASGAKERRSAKPAYRPDKPDRRPEKPKK